MGLAVSTLQQGRQSGHEGRICEQNSAVLTNNPIRTEIMLRIPLNLSTYSGGT
jgi:hypothetical protein